MRRTSVHAAIAFAALAAAGRGQSVEPTFRRVVVDTKFRSEGIAVADVNGDGRRDLLVGDLWYEAPTWTEHRIRPAPDLGDGANSYSSCFQCFAADVDRDGRADEIVVEFPGKRACWYRNPGPGAAADGAWARHVIADGVANESPQWVELFGDGRKGLLCGSQPDGGVVWLTPGADPTRPWDRVAIGGPNSPGSEPFAHGLGLGDLDGDGRRDVFATDGVWTQPAARTAAPWPFAATPLGGPCAQMHALDVDGDGLVDVVSSSAHGRGVWWHRQVRAADGAPSFVRGDVLTTITQTHALCIADIDGDGNLDLVTGKRWWAHGPAGDEDPAGTPYLVWIAIERGERGAPPRFVPHVIDDASGVGTQFEVADVDGDGRLDVAVANKKGVFVFLQEPARPAPREPWVTYRGTAGPGLGKTIVFVTGDEEYRSEESMPQLARLLAERLGFTCEVLFAVDPATGTIDPGVQTNVPGLEALAHADLMVVFTRFRDLPDAQMQPFVDYVESGRPIVGLRTATHAFDVRLHPQWRRWSWHNDEWAGGFGRQVLGATWIAHHGDHGRQGTRGVLVAAAADHPILRGIAAGDVWDPADVYAVRLPLPADCTALLEGEVLDGMVPDAPATTAAAKNAPRMPIAWTRLWRAPNGRDARVFTTTIGSAEAFARAGTRRLVVNACLWCLGMDDVIRDDLDVGLVGDYAPSAFGFGGHKQGVRPGDLRAGAEPSVR